MNPIKSFKEQSKSFGEIIIDIFIDGVVTQTINSEDPANMQVSEYPADQAKVIFDENVPMSMRVN